MDFSLITPITNEAKSIRIPASNAGLAALAGFQFSAEEMGSLGLETRVSSRTVSQQFFLLNACFKNLEVVKTAELPKTKTGLYFISTPNPVSPEMLREYSAISDQDKDEFFAVKRTTYNPRAYFQHFRGLVPSAICIHFGLHGPCYTFSSYDFAVQQAIEQVKCDLALNHIDFAIVMYCFTFENPFDLIYFHEKRGEEIFSEAACAVFLGRGDIERLNLNPDSERRKRFYGNGHDLVTSLMDSG